MRPARRAFGPSSQALQAPVGPREVRLRLPRLRASLDVAPMERDIAPRLPLSPSEGERHLTHLPEAHGSAYSSGLIAMIGVDSVTWRILPLVGGLGVRVMSDTRCTPQLAQDLIHNFRSCLPSTPVLRQ